MKDQETQEYLNQKSEMDVLAYEQIKQRAARMATFIQVKTEMETIEVAMSNLRNNLEELNWNQAGDELQAMYSHFEDLEVHIAHQE